MFRPIRCPHCRCEYLPGEIFQPEYFLGQPKDVVKNRFGEILGYEGVEMDTNETFVCTHCDKEFNVTAKIVFTVNDATEDEQEFEQLTLF